MADDNWFGDYMMGQLYGMGGGTGGAAGRLAREQQDRLARQQRENAEARQRARSRPSTASAGGVATIGNTIVSDRPLTPEELQKIKKRREEQRAKDSDATFAILLTLAVLGLAIYIDVQAAIAMPWYAHAVFALAPAIAVVCLLHRMPRLTHFLRCASQWALAILILAVVLWLCGR